MKPSDDSEQQQREAALENSTGLTQQRKISKPAASAIMALMQESPTASPVLSLHTTFSVCTQGLTSSVLVQISYAPALFTHLKCTNLQERFISAQE